MFIVFYFVGNQALCQRDFALGGCAEGLIGLNYLGHASKGLLAGKRFTETVAHKFTFAKGGVDGLTTLLAFFVRFLRYSLF